MCPASFGIKTKLKGEVSFSTVKKTCQSQRAKQCIGLDFVPVNKEAVLFKRKTWVHQIY